MTRIKLNFGQNDFGPKKEQPKARDFEETPLPDWEAWAGIKKPEIKGSDPISPSIEMGSDPFISHPNPTEAL